MVKRFKFNLGNESETTDPAEILTEGEAEINNLVNELGEVSLEGDRLFLAAEALDELIETTQEITEPTETELSLIQSNIENIARINDDAVLDVMPLAQNVVSVESYGKGRGLLALENAKKTMWARIKEWFAKFITWVKEKAKAILGYFTGTKKEAEVILGEAKTYGGKVTIEKPQVIVVKDNNTDKTTKTNVVELGDSRYIAEFDDVIRKYIKVIEEVNSKLWKVNLTEKEIEQVKQNYRIQIYDIETPLNRFLKKNFPGAEVTLARPSAIAKEDHPTVEGIEVTYEESDTPITINGIEVCEIIIESAKKQEEMAKILEKTSEKINELLKKAEGKFEGKEANMVADIIRTMSANVSTLAVTVPSKIVTIQKRQLKEIRRGLATAKA